MKWEEMEKRYPPVGARVLCRDKMRQVFLATFVDNPIMGYMFEQGHCPRWYSVPESVQAWAHIPTSGDP